MEWVVCRSQQSVTPAKTDSPSNARSHQLPPWDDACQPPILHDPEWALNCHVVEIPNYMWLFLSCRYQRKNGFPVQAQ
jgi:hypothetical protein